MKVILLQDISKVGRQNDVKDVSDGYARNFLFSRGLAKPATDSAMKMVEAGRVREEQERVGEQTKFKTLANVLGGTTLVFKMKVGEKGKSFGSVTAAKIAEAMKKQKIEVDKEWIVLAEPIKTTGESAVKIKFPHDIMGEVKIKVESE